MDWRRGGVQHHRSRFQLKDKRWIRLHYYEDVCTGGLSFNLTRNHGMPKHLNLPQTIQSLPNLLAKLFEDHSLATWEISSREVDGTH